MALKSIYEVLKEKEQQLQELQRLLNEAQAVLSRVLELDAAMINSEGPSRAADPIKEIRPARNGTNPWSSNGSVEFP
jgi:hypothetical protein